MYLIVVVNIIDAYKLLRNWRSGVAEADSNDKRKHE